MGTRRSMAKSSLLTCAALTLVPMVLADMAVASETRCVRGDDTIRRVAIEVQDPSRDAPCEVVYWKDTEEPGVRSVLWRAQTDAGYCAQKAEELIGRCGRSAGPAPSPASSRAPPAAKRHRRSPRRARRCAAPSPPADRAEPARRPRPRRRAAGSAAPAAAGRRATALAPPRTDDRAA